MSIIYSRYFTAILYSFVIQKEMLAAELNVGRLSDLFKPEP
jgi:hypothetical protein